MNVLQVLCGNSWRLPYLMSSCQNIWMIRSNTTAGAPTRTPAGPTAPHVSGWKTPGPSPRQVPIQQHYDTAAMMRRSSAALTMLPASTQTLTHLPRTGEQILSSILFDSIQA